MNNTPQTIEDPMKRRIQRAYILLKYAINNNLAVSDQVISDINNLYILSQGDKAFTLSDITALDTAIRELTKSTYPTTVNTIKYTLESPLGRNAQFGLILITIITIISGVYAYNMMMSAETEGIYQVLVAIIMGILGAELSIFFNFLGLSRELALGEGDIGKQISRLVFGAVVGYVSYFLFSMDSFGSIASNKELSSLDEKGKVLLILPLLMGYSVKLVFGILNKAIKAAEITLGLEDKADDLDQRNRQK